MACNLNKERLVELGWWGKIIGGYLGFVLGGPIGALLGAAIGHGFDKTPSGDSAIPRGSYRHQQRAQAAFFTATFSVMGHLCKADGRVCENEIEIARRVMDQMALSSLQKKAAIRLFNEGKKSSFPLEDVLLQLKSELGSAKNIRRMFVEIQISAAYADGVMHPDEKKLLVRICNIIGFPRYEFDSMVAAIAAEFHHHEAGGKPGEMSLRDARAILDVTKDSGRDEIKRSYRRLMSQHHPDKLIAKGLPEEMVEMATRRTQEIREAYDRLMKSL